MGTANYLSSQKQRNTGALDNNYMFIRRLRILNSRQKQSSKNHAVVYVSTDTEYKDSCKPHVRPFVSQQALKIQLPSVIWSKKSYCCCPGAGYISKFSKLLLELMFPSIYWKKFFGSLTPFVFLDLYFFKVHYSILISKNHNSTFLKIY